MWPMRIAWLALPVVMGFGFSDLLARRSDMIALTAEVGLWVGWFIGLVAVLAPSTVALTVLRIAAPATLAALLVALIADGWEFSIPVIVAIGGALAVTAIALSAFTGDVMVNGSSYGPERRMALRPPAALLLGPLQLVWLIVVAGLMTGPLLIAAEQTVAGVIAAIVGAAAAIAGTRSLHQLARRWIVFVPAGFVLHDYWALAESLLMQRRQVAGLGPAPLDKGEILDLSGGSQGLALMVELKEHTPLALRARSEVQTFSAHRIVFTPSLPGELLREARIRGVKIAS